MLSEYLPIVKAGFEVKIVPVCSCVMKFRFATRIPFDPVPKFVYLTVYESASPIIKLSKSLKLD